MSWILVSVVLLGVTPSAAEPQADLFVSPGELAAATALPPRSGDDLGKAAHETLRRWARANDAEAAAAAREYLALYDELSRDEKLPRAERESLQQKLRSRLIKLLPQINKRIAIEKRLAKDRPATVDAGLSAQPVLAQFGGGGRAGFGGGMPGMGAFGGAAGGWGGRPQPDDAGQELVDLIQRTIAPATWSVNGGPGAIYYWRPGRALVISATDGVHEQLGDVLGQLRRAGN